MRKFKLFFACLLMAVLSIGQMWGADVTVTWTASTGALGSAISSEGGTANGTIATTSGTEISYNWNYTRTLVTLKSGKSDYISMSGSYMQCGSSNAGESVEFRTSNIPGTIKSVTVLLGSKDSRHTGSITVGGTDYNAGDIPAWESNAGDEWGGTGTSTGEIVISIDCNSKKTPIYIASITVVYEGGSSPLVPTLSIEPSSLELEATGNSTQNIALTASNFESAVNAVTCAFYNTAACDGDAISQPAWITNLTDNNSDQVSFDVEDNDGEARGVWMKITASKGTESASAILAISQKLFVLDYATLPFAFNGGRADIENTSGITQEGLDSDYGDANTKLKFNTTGDWMIIKFNSDPGKLTYSIKNNSFSGGTFDVQESEDGTVYTGVASHTTITGTQNEEHNLKKDTRYVKFIYTSKSSGNVGLGNIGISVYVEPTAVEKPTFTPAAGAYEETKNVTISCATAGATIYYTLDESDPKTSATRAEYSSAISVSSTTTIKAYAVKTGLLDSDVAEATYTINIPADVFIDLTDGNWGFPTDNTTALTTYTNSETGYAVQCAATTAYKVSSTSYFLIGKQNSYMVLPTFSNPIAKIVVVKGSGSQPSSNVVFNIYDGDEAVSTPATGCDEDKEFVIDNPEEDKTYTLKVTSDHNLQLKGFKIYYGAAPAVKKPTITGNAAFVGSQDVTISCETDGAAIYYTTDATKKDNPSTTEWSAYDTKVTLNGSCTLYAAAKLGDDWSATASKEFTATPLYESIAELQDVATSAEATVFVKMTNWLVTAVSGSNAYVTDNTGNGMILYKYGHGFVANDKLNKAQLETTLQFYTDGGCAELKNLTTADFTGDGELAHNAEITPIDKTASQFAALTVANQGALFKVSDLTYDATNGKFMNGTDEVAYFNKFSIDESSLVDGHIYDVTGVAVYHKAGDVVQLCPRTAADLQDNTAYVEISFDANTTETYGGTLPTPVNHISGTDYTVPAASLTREDGYYQLGWNTSASATTALTSLENVTTNQTLYAIWKETANCTISFYSKGALYTTKVKAQNAEYDFSDVTPPSVQGWTFYGWTDSQIATEEASATKLTSVTPTSETMTLYAIFSRKVDGTPYTQYEKVTSAPSDWSGDYLIVYEGDNTHDAVAFNGGLETLDANLNRVAVTINESVIASSTAIDNAIFTVAAMTGGYSIQAHNGKYIYASSYANSLAVSDDPQVNGLAISEGAAVISVATSGGTVTMKYNYAENTERFRYYKSGQQNVQLYKAKEVTPQVDVYTTAPVVRYNITFALASGEEGTFNPISVEEGEDATLPTAVPTKSHNTFLKWSDGVNEYAAGATITNVQADIELHATWNPATYANVTFDVNGASGSAATIENVYEGEMYTLPVAPEYGDEDHVFAGWKLGDDVFAAGAERQMSTPAVAVEYVAQWNDVVYDQVVILAKYAGNWYAVKAAAGEANHTILGVQVDYRYGNIYDEFTPEQKAAITWTRKTVGNQMSFKNGDNYLTGKTSDSNDLDLTTDECFWTCDASADPAKYYTNSIHTILYSGSAEVFKNYKSSNATSGETGAYSALPVVVAAKFNTFYTRPNVSESKYGTICLPDSGILTNGALYEVAYYDDASKKIFFDEVLSGEMKAGMPYIFQPNEGVTELKVAYTDHANKTQAADVDDANGLVGNLGSTVTLSAGDYFLYNNQYYVVSASETRTISVPQYYAYINMDEVPDYPTAPAPGRRRVSMNVNGEQVATGMDELNASETPVKVMIDGQLFIIRGEKMYDATGRLVK